MEANRLQDQAATLTDLLHDGTSYAAGERVLEAGCGVGAQTTVLAARSPECELVAVDVAAPSVALARERVRRAGLGNVSFHVADLHALPFAPDSFDHVFVCFVLEHLPDPPASLAALCTVLKPGGSLTVIEGDHGSAYFHPDNAAAREAIAHLVELQRRAGGDATIGRTLYALLGSCGLVDVQVVPRLVYADAAHPELVDGFSRRTFTAMIAGVRDAALAAALTHSRPIRRGHTSTPPQHGVRRRVLLHLLQGCRAPRGAAAAPPGGDLTGDLTRPAAARTVASRGCGRA